MTHNLTIHLWISIWMFVLLRLYFTKKIDQRDFFLILSLISPTFTDIRPRKKKTLFYGPDRPIFPFWKGFFFFFIVCYNHVKSAVLAVWQIFSLLRGVPCPPWSPTPPPSYATDPNTYTYMKKLWSLKDKPTPYNKAHKILRSTQDIIFHIMHNIVKSYNIHRHYTLPVFNNPPCTSST